MKRNCFLAFLCGLTFALLADTISPMSPKNGDLVSMLRPEQQLFCHLKAAEGRKLLANASVREYLCQTIKSFPKGVELTWVFTGVLSQVHFEVTLADNEDFADARVISTDRNSLTLYNLFNGKTYYWKVVVVYKDGGRLETQPQSFTVDDQTPRFLYVPNVDNVRDLGGFKGLEGRVIPQGLIYRSSGLNANSSDGGKTSGRPRANADGVARMRDELHLRTELDLRSLVETAGMTVSPIGEDIHYVPISVGAYEPIFRPAGMPPYADCFRVFLNPANYPIDFHCIGGADRTGSLAFLLEALLGADVEHLYRDYVLTSFYINVRDYDMCDSLFCGLQGFGTAEESLCTKAERYFFATGITPDEIDTFRAFILGPGLAETPGCALQRRIEAICSDYATPTEELAVGPFYPYGAKMRMAGKDIPLNAPLWTNTPVQKITTNRQGAYLVQLLNHDAEPRFIAFRHPERLTGEAYTVIDLLDNVAYSQEDGKTAWSPKELRRFALELPVGVPRLLLVTSETTLPADCTVKTMPRPTIQEPGYLVVPSGPAPVIDGVLDDEIWALREPLKCFTMNGLEDENAPSVHLRTDLEHETLYIAAEIPDITPDGEDHASQRDCPLWEEDEIEIFVGGYGRVHYFQFIFNRFGNIWDGLFPRKAWDAEEYQVATKQTDAGWTIEIALPIRLFDYSSPLEVNVCFTDNPRGKHYALYPTGDSFHNRNSFQTLFLK